MTTIARRELATRNATWAQRLAAVLALLGVRPNVVSAISVVFALAASAAFAGAGTGEGSSRAFLFLAAAAAVQMRLLCNLLDGMLAVEQGLKTVHGDLFNEIPDRLADIAILVGAGCAVRAVSGGVALGCAAAITALFTAYVRVLGGALTRVQPFIGPMAKQHRMFVVTVAAVLAAGEAAAGLPPRAMPTALVVITAGAAVTACRRIRRISTEMEAQCSRN
jgi:phosphatidylglycerophosphate synthase